MVIIEKGKNREERIAFVQKTVKDYLLERGEDNVTQSCNCGCEFIPGKEDYKLSLRADKHDRVIIFSYDCPNCGKRHLTREEISFQESYLEIKEALKIVKEEIKK